MKTTTILLTTELSETHLSILEQKWTALSSQLELSRTRSERYFKKLQLHYNESHRAYHNLSHLYSMLHLLEQHEALLEQPALVQLAIWYHDLIYIAWRKDNELKSAELLQKAFRDKLGSETAEICYQLILSTKKHELLLEGIDNKLLLDLDLAVLASDETTYKIYAKAIRKEYWMYPSFLYKKGRKQVLQHFLQRERIYFSDTFFVAYEAKARENIAQEIERL